MRLAVIGAGYVGLTSGACLAALGHEVTVIDIDRARVARLDRGEMPIYEPGLDTLVAEGRAAGRLNFSASVGGPVSAADAVFLAVGTPSRADGSIDLSVIEEAARQVAPALKHDAVVVVKSTVIAGTARRLREIMAEARGGLDFSVASNPEFLREGSAVRDFMEPDRIVVGADDPRARKALEAIYAPLLQQGVASVFTTTVNAELTKYAANALLALKIGFINEVADLCEAVGGDVTLVANGVGHDRRIGRHFLDDGPGFGGSCFPKDTRALAALGRAHGVTLGLTETLIRTNEERKTRLARRVLGELGPRVRGARVALFGLAFKANTDDMREAAALSLAPALLDAGCEVAVHDPKAGNRALLPGVRWHDDPYRAALGAEAVVVLTEWDDYRQLDLDQLQRVMAGRTLFDCRNLFDPAGVEAAGLRYFGIGRAAARTRQHLEPARLKNRVFGQQGG